VTILAHSHKRPRGLGGTERCAATDGTRANGLVETTISSIPVTHAGPLTQ